jgi:aminoglycoside phosphotransferase (APT) family kinase protein
VTSPLRPPYPVPPLDSARRLEWPHLAPYLREHVEERCGSPVLGVESIEAGFTPGFASVLTCADGTQHFVKAAAKKAQRPFAASYAEEVRHLGTLPAGVPAPRLLWHDEDEEWIVFATAFVDAEPVARPWSPRDLDACLDALDILAERFTPAPASMGLRPFTAETADWGSAWQGLTPPSHTDRRDEAVALAARAGELLLGETLVHGDLRADNALVTDAGTAWFCDWNWPAVGPAWLDPFMLLVGAYGDGLDVDAVIAARPLLREAPSEAVDSLLALMAGYFLRAGCGSVPPNSPHVRDHQYWTGTICWLWLAERRRW